MGCSGRCFNIDIYFCSYCTWSQKIKNLKYPKAKVHTHECLLERLSLCLFSASALKPEDSYCTNHEGERFCIYCEKCSQLLCLKCVADHASHELLNVDKALAKCKVSSPCSLYTVESLPWIS